MLKQLDHEPFALILSAASGSGKGTMAKKLLSEFSHLSLSISSTTRSIRPGEIHGKDYFFIKEEEFQQMIKEKKFFEWAHVYGNYYGTSIQSVMDFFEQKQDVLLDIDWQGANQVKDILKSRAVVIHILPPSYEILKQRLIDRGQDDLTIIDERMKKAKDEVSHWKESDYVVLNYNLEQVAKEIKAIFIAETKKRSRISHMEKIDQEFLRS